MNKEMKIPFAPQKKIVTALMVCVLFLAAGNLSSCSQKDDNDGTNEESISIIGRWKLEKVDVGFPINQKTYHYSRYGIVYEFAENNVLTVSGNTDKIDYRGHEIGDHFYEMNYNIRELEENPCPLCLPYPFMVKIDTLPYSYLLSSKELEIEHIGYDDIGIDCMYVYYLSKLK